MKRKEKNLVNTKERAILQVLQNEGSASTSRIVEVTGMSWQTAVKYLKKLAEEEIIKEVGKGAEGKSKKK